MEMIGHSSHRQMSHTDLYLKADVGRILLAQGHCDLYHEFYTWLFIDIYRMDRQIVLHGIRQVSKE